MIMEKVRCGTIVSGIGRAAGLASEPCSGPRNGPVTDVAIFADVCIILNMPKFEFDGEIIQKAIVSKDVVDYA